MPAVFKITMKRAKLVPNTQKGTQVLYNRSKDIFLKACRGYVEGLAESIGPHVDTGMSFASIIPFARFVNAVNIEIPSHNLPRKGMTDVSGKYWKDRYKSVSEGLSAGLRRKAFQINFGSLARPIFSMWFSIQVFQYILHEYGYQTLAWNSRITAYRRYSEVLYNYLASRISGRRTLLRVNDFCDIKYETIVR